MDLILKTNGFKSFEFSEKLIKFRSIRLVANRTVNQVNLLWLFNFLLVQNFKNSKPFESSKYKKHDQIWTKITTQNKQLWENQQKRRKEKKAVLQNPFLFFLSFVLFCLYLPQPSTYKNNYLRDVSVLFEILQNWNSKIGRASCRERV